MLFEVEPETGFHFVDLWNNVELQPKRVGGKYLIKTAISPFNPSWQGTDNEGENGCIARFPSLINLNSETTDILSLNASEGDLIRIWKGNPSYAMSPIELKPGKYNLRQLPQLKGYDGKLVVQLFQNKSLIDQRVFNAGDETPETKIIFSKPEDVNEYHSANLDVVLNRQEDQMKIERKNGTRIEIVPKYLPASSAISLTEPSVNIKLLEQFGRYEGDFIIRLYGTQNQLIDQGTVYMPYGYPRMAETPAVHGPTGIVPPRMVQVPAGEFTFRAAQKIGRAHV